MKAGQPNPPWRYAVTTTNTAKGTERRVVVWLTEAERADALRHLALRGPGGPGGHTGPIVNGYALRRAVETVGTDYDKFSVEFLRLSCVE